ncbi:hydroxyethylthiazole kinase [Amphritea balenae]|uniref:Hydroxyethylthiazole kinase n=1 Tax=Amphritea balenae TaxID=452629 RepID=A0A3P1SQF8_9GAMM|nr:hydroxyethylthiazole kinase [Amphritea balenae]RRC99353.1 hydroxyethylthiazole kinase [Amphritea balenae]GGK71832.1 hydroxyethylthiazole kinase [Amphritea balenae]
MSATFKVFDIESQSNIDYARSCAAMLAMIAKQKPRIQCITNTVAMDFTSDMLLAVGARPSLTMGVDEIREFVASCDSLSINIGTLDSARKAAIRPAIETALDYQRPWVLDPVSVHASDTRCDYARELLELKPTVIRGNSAEIKALLGQNTPEAAWLLAQQTGAVVAQTGEADIVTDGSKALMIANGHLMQTRVSAMGCAATAFVATFLSVNRRAFDATVQALLAISVAAEIAAQRANGPGSLHMHILDTLFSLDQEQLEARCHLLKCEEVAA